MRVLAIVIICFAVACSSTEHQRPYDADILVYGATSGGITAAIQAAKAGKKVLLVEPSSHIGGTTTGGLVWTDYGVEGVVGGLAGE